MGLRTKGHAEKNWWGLRYAQVINAVAEVFSFVNRASDVLSQPVGTELGADTPRFLLEQVRQNCGLPCTG